MPSVDTAQDIIDLATAQLGATPLVFHILDNSAGYSFWLGLPRFTDTNMAGASNITVTAYAGTGTFKDDYTYGGGGGSGTTVLFREADTTVSVIGLATPWTPILSREADTTVTVN